ncbi:MAG: hypothetical protein Q4F79_12500 [Eubacteriales bacterium]|nr:hypothetical protein [Eubacteriales bacterium]
MKILGCIFLIVLSASLARNAEQEDNVGVAIGAAISLVCAVILVLSAVGFV